VLKLKDECGEWLDTQQEITEKLVADYTVCFSTSYGSNRRLQDTNLESQVTTSKNMSLLQVPNREEVKQALFSIDSTKTPGPDGYGVGFFRKYWNIIQNGFQACITEFFINGKLLRQINHTFIALIPKIDDPNQTHHFRPISLCSTIYKTIAKIIINRLRPLLDCLVSPVQSVFIPGRSIHDNILLTSEIMHKFRKVTGKIAWVALKLDMEKAYDRLEWDFIKNCLRQYGFHSRFIKLIMECITTVSYSLLVNGESVGMIKPTRGIRQGDPLSPYIFILCMEVMNSMLSTTAQNPKSGVGIKICPSAERIPWLLFADDCLLF